MGRYHEWVHYALSVTVAMLCSMGLEANLKKTKSMVCIPRLIWGKWGDTAYKRWETGEGATFREQKKTRVSYNKCGVTVAVSYLKTHMAQIHAICVLQKRGVSEVGGGQTTYV